jgi:pimeloyl-ACP methyl ester carboxylesterase
LRSFVVDVVFVVEDLCTLLKALNGARPVLVGASMGGGTSLVAVGVGRIHDDVIGIPAGRRQPDPVPTSVG